MRLCVRWKPFRSGLPREDVGDPGDPGDPGDVGEAGSSSPSLEPAFPPPTRFYLDSESILKPILKQILKSILREKSEKRLVYLVVRRNS
jgi:hypothetical protein